MRDAFIHRASCQFSMSGFAVDSEAYFKGRVQQLGLEVHYEKFISEGRKWGTLGRFAFASWWQPNSPNPEVFIKDVIVPILGDEAHPDRDQLRRLYFEAYAAVSGDIARRTEGREDDEAPRNVPLPERTARWDKITARLKGYDFENDRKFMPSHWLQDLVSKMHDSNTMAHIAWADCSAREQESAGQKKIPMWIPDKNNTMVLKDGVSDPARADTSTDLLLKYVFLRRGFALEMYDLLSFENHELLAGLLIAEMMRQPPPGYAKVSLDQILLADKEAFLLMGLMCPKGIRRDGKITRPLDDIFLRLLDKSSFRMHLHPLPIGANRAAKRDRDDDEVSELRREVGRLRKQLDSQSQARGSRDGQAQNDAKNANKGDGKGRKKRGNMPSDLQGMMGRTVDDQPICYDDNRKVGCTAATPGERCRRGFHVCCHPNCGKTLRNTRAMGAQHRHPTTSARTVRRARAVIVGSSERGALRERGQGSTARVMVTGSSRSLSQRTCTFRLLAQLRPSS